MDNESLQSRWSAAFVRLHLFALLCILQSWSSTPKHQSPLRHESSLLMKLLKKRKKWEHQAIIPSNVAADMQPSISAQLKLYLTREKRQGDLLRLGLSFPLISLLSLGSLSTTYLIFRQPCEVSCGVLMKSEDRDEKQEEEMRCGGGHWPLAMSSFSHWTADYSTSKYACPFLPWYFVDTS